VVSEVRHRVEKLVEEIESRESHRRQQILIGGGGCTVHRDGD
jgi:NADH dehydrogenase FAD-containing subunit